MSYIYSDTAARGDAETRRPDTKEGVTINGCTAAEWSADLELADEFLRAASKLRGTGEVLCLVRGTTEAEMHDTLPPRAKALVSIARHLGGRMKGISIVIEEGGV